MTDDWLSRNPDLTAEDIQWLSESYGLSTENKRKRGKQTDYALVLYIRIQTLAPELLDGLEREYRFHDVRRYRFDMAYPFISQPMAIECQGGRYMAAGGRHMSTGDFEKMQLACELGWRVYPVLPEQIKQDPLRILEQLKRILGR